MLKRVLFRAAAVVAVLALGGSAKADFIIDNFTTPISFTGLVGVTGNGVQTVARTDTYASAGSGSITRVLTVNQTQNVLGNNATQYGIGQVSTGGGIFTLATANGTNQATAASAYVTLQYNYAAPQNLSAGGTSIQFTFSGADLGSIPYSVRISDGTNTATQSGAATSGAGVYSLSTSSFTGVNLNAVTSVLLSLNRNLQTGGGDQLSADFTLNDVRVLTPTAPPSVPAPPAAVLVLAALPVLGLARARRLLPV